MQETKMKGGWMAGEAAAVTGHNMMPLLLYLFPTISKFMQSCTGKSEFLCPSNTFSYATLCVHSLSEVSQAKCSWQQLEVPSAKESGKGCLLVSAKAAALIQGWAVKFLAGFVCDVPAHCSWHDLCGTSLYLLQTHTWLSDLSYVSYPNSSTSQEGKWEGKTTSILGREKVGNLTQINLAKNVFSYWFNQLLIQNVTENVIWRNSRI